MNINDFFDQGEFLVEMPDGVIDDYDNAIPDYYANLENLGECIDSNGSECSLYNADGDKVIADFIIYDREFDYGSWEEKSFRATGKIMHFEDDFLYKIDKLDEL